MGKYCLLLTSFLLLCAPKAFSQGLDTTAKKGDWEEINFAFDRAVLTDGFPSLLRLAELLNKNPDYRVTLEGHADYRGSDAYNLKLSNARAQTVKDFLVKYGARENQVSLTPRGEGSPKVSNETREGRWMNRRVAITATDGQGRVVSDGGVGEAIDSISKLVAKQEECCDKILRKLDKLDDILAALKGLKTENDELRRDIAELRKKQEGLKDQVGDLAEAPKPPTKEEVAQAVEAAAPKPSKKFSILNLNVGPDMPDGNFTATGKGRVFLPFAQRHAFQAEGEFMHFLDRDEGQVDVGLVNRFGNVQAGLFSSFKRVRFDDFQQGGTLGQGSVTVDYVFNRGRVGFFGSKGFMDGGVLNRAILQPNVVEESYLSLVDQAGLSATVGAWGNTWFEGSVGALFRDGGDNKAGGTIRYIHPITDVIAFTAEAGVNETLISNDNTGRVVFGLQFGKWLSPKDYSLDENRPVPVEIPRIRYEVLTRRVRTGNDAPVADAGLDQIGIEAGQVVLNGSASFDPDGDPITFQWEQIGGPGVQLTGADSEQASFTAAEGETYHFRLTVRDDRNGIGTDRITVSTLDREIRIVRFTADPLRVDGGEPVTLIWEVENATEVEITGLGSVDPKAGSTTVTPTETTTYTLSARNPKRELSSSVTVTVNPPAAPKILNFFASPNQIQAGEQSTLFWEVQNATQVSIAGIGAVSLSGSTVVTPEETTTFTLTASSDIGEVTATTVVTVTPAGAAVRILEFTAEPTVAAKPGDPVVLRWVTENATEVVITGVGEVESSGSLTVNPVVKTTYTLNARGVNTEATAIVIVEIENANRSPIADARAAWLVRGPGDGTTSTVLKGSFSTDPDGDPLTFEWRNIGSLEAEIISPNSADPRVVFKGGEGFYEFELTVTDDKGLRSFDTVRVAVADL